MNRIRLATFLPVLSCWLLMPVGLAFADGAVLYVSPDNGAYSIGDTFTIQVEADSGDQNINAAEADITFDPKALAVQSISTDGSILTTWPTPARFSNDDGTIVFSGLANQKYKGVTGLLITVTFEALTDTSAELHFESGAILAADGVESNVVTSMHSGLYAIAPVEVPAAPADTSISTDASSSSAGSGESNDAPASNVAPPVLLDYQNAISVGDRIMVRGSAPPSSTISVWLKEGSGDPTRTDMDVDASGSFTYVSDTQSVPGVYEIWAVTQGAAGKSSVRSNKIDITAIPPGTASVALVEASIASNLIPFLALIIFAGLATGYLFHRHKLEKFKIQHQQKVD